MFVLGLVIGVLLGSAVISCGFINSIFAMQRKISYLQDKLQQAYEQCE